MCCLAAGLDKPASAEPRSSQGPRGRAPQPSAWLASHEHLLASAAFVKRWQKLRAPDAVIALLMTSVEGTPAYDAAFVERHLVLAPAREFPFARFEMSFGTIGHVQTSVACARYARMVALGLEPLDALRLSYELLDGTYRFLRPLPFRKYFSAVCHLAGAYGAPKVLEFAECASCGMRRVVCTLDARRLGCPFCRLLRAPNRYLKTRHVHDRHSARLRGDPDGMVSFVG